MNYTLQASECGRYIHVTYHGAINRAIGVQVNQEAAELGKQLDIHLYLMDFVDARNVDGILEQYHFAHSDMQHADEIERSATVAVLVTENDHSHDFVETVLQNAGFQVKLFTDREQAIHYLLRFEQSGKRK